MTYSTFNTLVQTLMADQGYGYDEACMSAKEDLLASNFGDLLASDPGYIAWSIRQDKLDRRFHEEHDR